MDFFGLFDRKQKSGQIAKSRLQLVLFQDRMNTSPEMIEMLKSDIIKVLANYVDIDEDGLDIKIGSQADGGSNDAGPALMANIPIKGWKKR
ncbi:MAG: cell division topological specificity factor MinE [Defluviitaleaceae bacterium]|nr:cell division topological specificity factor MinE [Defluviitaleaceae bacterium]